MQLANLRRWFNAPWIFVVTGCLYLLSQAALGAIFDRIGTAELFNMQVSFFSAEQYLQFFSQLNDQRLLDVYASHLHLDYLHPLWYALFATSVLAVLMERLQLSSKANVMLALPWLAAGCDAIENRIQQIFLLGDEHITDTLATLTTTASIAKWTIVAVFMLVILLWWGQLLLRKVKK